MCYDMLIRARKEQGRKMVTVYFELDDRDIISNPERAVDTSQISIKPMLYKTMLL